MKKILLTVTLVLSAFLMMAQGVTGTVTDDAGEGLPGATVLVKGTQNGAITDVDGKFTLDVSEGTLLVVSFMGFESQEATASNNMEVTLQIRLILCWMKLNLEKLQ